MVKARKSWLTARQNGSGLSLSGARAFDEKGKVKYEKSIFLVNNFNLFFGGLRRRANQILNDTTITV